MKKNALANEFRTQGKMTFYYNDSKDRPCIFITTPCPSMETGVPSPSSP
jgi:hypothetical protein